MHAKPPEITIRTLQCRLFLIWEEYSTLQQLVSSVAFVLDKMNSIDWFDFFSCNGANSENFSVVTYIAYLWLYLLMLLVSSSCFAVL